MRSARALPILVLAVLFSSAGCVGLDPAFIPSRYLEPEADNGWQLEFSSGVDGGASTKHAHLKYLDEADDGAGYPGAITLQSFRGLLSPDRDELRERAADSLEEQSLEKGYRIEGARREGERTLANGARSLYIVLTTKATAGSELFQDDATIKAMAEVFRCTGGATVVVSGSAQIDQVRSIGGIPTTTERDARTWEEIVEDPGGSIEGHRGSQGLLYNIACG